MTAAITNTGAYLWPACAVLFLAGCLLLRGRVSRWIDGEQ